ncbi:MAG: hypothetical protein QXT35_01340 [Conexivisphaerales archaeon]
MPEVIKTVATRGEGISYLASAIEGYLQKDSRTRQEMIKSRLKQLVRYHIEYRLDRYLEGRDFEAMVNELLSGKGISEVISQAASELTK